ncbi:MAG: SDR family NAD(P)-dependent oxidoreductase [Burkholderiaceae bacterium]
MNPGLTDRVAIVTGSGRGIGLAEARALAAEGAVLVINDLDETNARTACEALLAAGHRAEYHVGDVTDEAFVERMVSAVVDRHGRLDLLVNNAGPAVRPAVPVESMSTDQWEQMLRGHLRSTFLCSRAAIPPMRRGGFGRIVNTSSMNFTGGGRIGVAHYAAAKAGVAGFSATLAKEVGPYGITANAIAPGYVETELIANFTPEMREMLRRQNPVGRTCKVEEVAAAVVYLCSEQAAFVNGELLCLDGGRRDFYWG